MKVHHGCPVQATINVLSGKWKVQAVWRLSFGPLRFAELRNLLSGVSEKVLTAQLRELEKDGVVTRREARSSPPKVTYSLSRSGQTLIPVVNRFSGSAACFFSKNASISGYACLRLS